MRRFQARITAFWQDQRGAFATIFGILLIVIVATSGAVVDFVGVQQARNKAQLALDAATLALQPNIYTWTDDELMGAAEDLMVERIADDTISVDVESVEVDEEDGKLYFLAKLNVPTVFVSLVNIPSMDVRVASQAMAGGNDVEVSLVLDITGSMAGDKIVDLRAAANDFVDIVVKDDQDPFYSKVALVPYSNSVNVAGYAAQVRGSVTGSTGITNAVWKSGGTKNITGATRASQAVITSANHGLINGDYIRITSVSGMTQLNSKNYIVSDKTTNTFKIKNATTGAYINSSSYSNYSSGGLIQKCLAALCEVVVTSNAHGISNGESVKITGVNGMTQINNTGNASWLVNSVTADTFQLSASTGWSYGTYTNSGSSWCLLAGCEYYRFLNASADAARIFQISTCTSERTGAEAFTDAAPTTALLGRNYPASNNPCPTETEIVPLTADKVLLGNEIDDLEESGSTGGHIGIAWGWYLLAPSFGYLFPAESQPGAYNADNLIKVAVLMTDAAAPPPPAGSHDG
ncbi:MAG: ubiquitin-activating E1 FCCH domain-containing protein, partial [Cucumibacter sp.]